MSPQQRLARVADMKNTHDVVLNNVENAIYAFSATEQELADRLFKLAIFPRKRITMRVGGERLKCVQ